MHWLKRYFRGYNQAEELARELSKRLGVPAIGALRRLRNDPPQASLDQERRRRNLSGAFGLDSRGAERLALVQRQNPRGLVALVDDVCTTGTTAELCARQLRRAGCRNIVLLSVAKT